MAEIGSAFISLLPSMRGFGNAVEREGSGPMASVGSKFGKVLGGALVAGTAAAGAAIAAGVMGGMENEVSTDRMAAALGLGPAESERLGGVAGSLYAEAYGDSFADVTTAVESVYSSIAGMSSASSSELESATEAALNFASAFEVDVSRSSQIAGQLLTTGLAADATEAFDLITAASQRVPTAVREDVLDAADEYGQFFSTLGFSGEEAFAVLVDGAEKGMYGIDKAGDALKEFTIRATDMSTASVGAYDTLGLSADDMAAQLLAGGDTAQAAFQQIIDGLLGVEDPATRANTAIALFGTPLEDLSVSEIPTFLQSLQDGSDAMAGFSGSAEAMGETLNDNAATRIEEFKRTVETALVNFVGNEVLPLLQSFGLWFAAYVVPYVDLAREAVENFWPTLQALGTWVATLLAEHAPMLQEVALTFIDAFASAGDAIGAFVAFATIAWNLLGENLLAGTLATFGFLAQVIGGAFDVIAGILNFFVALFTGDWSGMWEAVKQILSGAWAIITGLIGQALNLVLTALGSWGALVKSTIGGIWNGAVDLVRSAGSNIVSAVASIPGRILGLAGSFLSAGISIITSLINGLSNAPDFVSNIAGNIWNAIKSALNAGINAVNAALNITIDPPGPLGPWAFDLGQIPRFEKGTNYAPGGVALVGEAGPELVELPRGSRVIPNHKITGELDALEVGSGGGTDSTAVIAAITSALSSMRVGVTVAPSARQQAELWVNGQHHALTFS